MDLMHHIQKSVHFKNDLSFLMESLKRIDRDDLADKLMEIPNINSKCKTLDELEEVEVQRLIMFDIAQNIDNQNFCKIKGRLMLSNDIIGKAKLDMCESPLDLLQEFENSGHISIADNRYTYETYEFLCTNIGKIIGDTKVDGLIELIRINNPLDDEVDLTITRKQEKLGQGGFGTVYKWGKAYI
jgi:hypothetical protein